MPERPIGVTDEPPGAGVAEYRTRQRTVSGNTVVEQYLIYEGERVISFRGMASTFRIPPGLVAQPLAYLFNRTGSGVLVALRRALVAISNTSNTGTVRTVQASMITTEPTGGTVNTPVAFDTTQTGSSSVVFKGGASADGTNSAITATLGSRAWDQMGQRMASNVDQVRSPDGTLVPSVAEKDPLVLREGQGILFSYAAADTPSGSAQHIVDLMWEEFTLP